MTVLAARESRTWRAMLPDRSARLRLTLLYSGMFLILGTAIVVVIFVLGSGSTSVSQVSSAAASGAGREAIHAAATQQHTSDVNQLLAGAWVTLVLTALASAILGWFVARRVLRPLRQMTTATQAISAGSLHQRLALEGADDEFKQLGDTIDDLLARLESSFAAQRRFVANAAHELRTPLTVERTLLQVALANPDASAESLRATCEELLASGRDHERLLDSLLTLAVSERGLERREVVDLTAITRSVAAHVQAELQGRSIALDMQLEPASVTGDRALLERLVANLVDNAVRYNEWNGRVTVRTLAEQGQVRLSVTNTGPLISPDLVESLFEPFRRLHAQRTGDDGHHGLGLSIVRAVADTHGATLLATPSPDGGLTVSVAFPLPGEHPGGAPTG
jgi:signal transduction histidine kinase